MRVKLGDYVESELAQRVDTAKLVGDIVEHWHRLGQGRRTVCFTVNVAHSVHIRDEFRRAGAMAEHIDGSTPLEERKNILTKLARGSVDIVCNCMVLTEGWDRPEASCLILARPTKSLGLYRQMVGRVLRPADGKTDALILDHAGAVFAHGFPDDDVCWTLHEDRRAENQAHSARGQYNAPALTTCPECHAVRFEGRPCSICGWHPVTKPKRIDIADGELSQVDHLRNTRPTEWPRAEQLAFYRQLRGIGQHRGYKPGWAANQFRERFGRFPPWGWNNMEPLAPSPAVASWVRSRMIAYAKSQPRP